MSEPAIELHGLAKRFGDKLAVNDVTLRVDQGSCYGLIGPNGAGKTTTFSMMCGYLHPTAGSVRILGADPQVAGSLKRKVGVLPQDAILPAWEDVGPLLTFYAQLSGLPTPADEARRALDKVGLADAWNTRAGALSHGMAKRVALAQALLGSPPVVLLDEPTAGLDPKIAHQIRSVVREMRGKQTIVISSHNLTELEELCDGAAILDRGRLVQSGSMSSLTSQSDELRVTIASGALPLAELQALPGVQVAAAESPTTVLIRFDPKSASPEEQLTRVLKLLIDRGLLIASTSRGHKLEDRVMQLT